jgi:hypothetical protein
MFSDGVARGRGQLDALEAELAVTRAESTLGEVRNADRIAREALVTATTDARFRSPPGSAGAPGPSRATSAAMRIASPWSSVDAAPRSEARAGQVVGLLPIRGGKLQCREASMHGNPWLRLLRREVEALVRAKHGHDYLKYQQAKTELARVDRDLKRLKTRVAALEERKSQVIAEIGKKRTRSRER